MRVRLSDGEPEKPLVIHVGCFGREKNLDFLKMVMDRLPGVRIAFIGDGPYRTITSTMMTVEYNNCLGTRNCEDLS
ncbi:sulfoquinovosyl transferase SQD2-like [Miscanthus floridulus]|uniref:sulfoquinovosyl transferase SQD2-like n=1 Tax=Miscanthus floridulus TaxID=154761 RepID=UPI00345A179C